MKPLSVLRLRPVTSALAAAFVAALSPAANAQELAPIDASPVVIAAPQPPQQPVELRLEPAPDAAAAPPADAIRSAVERELSTPVVLGPQAPAQPHGVLTVSIDAERRVTVRFRGADGNEVARVVVLPPGGTSPVGTIALLAGNLARDESAQLLAQLPPPPPLDPIRVGPPAFPPAPAPALEYSPFVFSLVPMVSTDGFEGARYRHSVGLHFLGGYTGAIEGLEASMGVNVVQRHMHGLQLGYLFNWVGEGVRGVQASALANVAGELSGLQLSEVVNVSRGAAQGGQLSLAFNYAGDLRGLQYSAGVNVVRGAMRGAQLGLVNYAGDNRGLQLGLLNISGGGPGVSVGLLNFVRGQPVHFELGFGTLPALSLSVRHGGKYVRNVYSISIAPFASATTWMVGAGLGFHFDQGRVEFDVDAMIHQVNRGRFWRGGTNLLAQLRFSVAVPLARRFALQFGAAINYMDADTPENLELVVGPRKMFTPNGASHAEVLWPSLSAGVRF